MKLVIQRVKEARVLVNGKITGQIEKGLLVLVGIGKNDTGKEINWLVNKTLGLRIFEDDAGKMNLSLRDIKGKILLVSQFTLYADCQKGCRPGFEPAADPKIAKSLYETFVHKVRESGLDTQTGVFGADMQVSLINDGPVTIILEK